MIATYDPLLVALSVVIAILGSYTGLRLARRLAPKSGSARKALLSGAAVAIGCGIWSMHFIGMLAMQLPVTVSYDVLLTLISALVAILVTGLGLFMASYGELNLRKLAVAGLFMGLGISTMHYIGMAAVRTSVTHQYDASLVVTSVLIGIAASTLALWLAFAQNNPRPRIAAAIVMGLAISGMHYTAMSAMAFGPAKVPVVISAPLLSPQLLAIVVAVAAFLIFGFTLLVALPDGPREQADGDGAAGEEPGAQHAAAGQTQPVPRGGPLFKLPVQKNKTTLFLDMESVVSVRADAHYTRIHDGNESYFCSLSLSELEARLDPQIFLRVHRSYIVNLRHARSFERRNEQGLIRLAGRAAPSVPVSRRNVPKLRSALGLHH
jgi:NO-binding membrane sensor protein with MHYT domain